VGNITNNSATEQPSTQEAIRTSGLLLHSQQILLQVATILYYISADGGTPTAEANCNWQGGAAWRFSTFTGELEFGYS